MTAGHEVTAPRPTTMTRTRAVTLRLIRGVAWLLIGLGLLVGLYLVYSLFFTNLQTEAEQSRLLQDWQNRLDELDSNPVPMALPTVTPSPRPSAPEADDVPTATEPPAEDPVVGEALPEAPSGEAVALLWFERPGEPDPVTDEPYVVLSGVTMADLAKGPGHYTQTADPGAEGNFAVAGHRTTYGAPFFHLDDLREGDEIHVMDTSGEVFVYAFREQRIVAPTNLSVLDPHPLGEPVPTITLTTCHPRFSNRQRLIVFGELVT